MKFNKLIIAFSLCCVSFSSKAQIYINEFMSNNQTFVLDGFGEYSDWIELYNAGASTVNLANYALSDNPDSIRKWIFPSRTLAAGAFIRIWCSGKNILTGTLHTNFSIDSQGETIFLSDATGTVIDNYGAVFMPSNVSYGRLPNGSPNLVHLSTPTPAASNNVASAMTGVLTDLPSFSVPGGLYPNPVSLSFTHTDPTVTIHYTLDGSEPTEASPVFTAPLFLQDKTSDPNFYSLIRTAYQRYAWLPDWYPPIGNVYKANIVRARAFKTGYVPGPVQTATYFIDPNIFGRYGNLPLVSVVSDPKHLFNDTTGIYVPGLLYNPPATYGNYEQGWSRPANIEMYWADGRQAFNSNFKISINGQSSTSSPQKGLNANATTDYGENKFNYPVFENAAGPAKYIRRFDKLKFRAWGSDRIKALFRDAYCMQFMRKTKLDYEEYQLCIVFINGEYWGFQELRERDREGSYFEEHYLIDSKNPGFDIIDGAGNTAIEGDNLHWNAISGFISTNSMANPANYAYAKTQIDMESLMLHYMFSIYLSRGDWPDQNEAKWRPRVPGGKWKWIMWDMDNTTAHYLNPWYDMFQQTLVGNRGYGPSALLNSLLQSPEFKNEFINLFADFMNTEFLPPLMQKKVDQMKQPFVSTFSEYQNRWQVNYNWQTSLDSIKWWVGLRPSFCKQHILSTFGLPSVHNLTLDVSDTLKGNIKVNTVFLDSTTARIIEPTYPWLGEYFQGVPVPLTAIAKPGYKFLHWLPGGNTNASISLSLTGSTSLTAVFDVDPDYKPMLPPVINEIMASNLSTIADNYGEYDDWIEIYNPNPDTIDLAGYYLSDNLVLPTRFQLQSGTDSTKIPPYGFLLIWIDDDPEQGLLHSNFKMNAAGDLIMLVHTDGVSIVDSIRFGPQITDVSLGRSYDASPTLVNFTSPTPDATNVISPGENLLINEVLSVNVNSVTDEYGEHNPWLEIYNPNADTLDLAGWHLSNEAGKPSKFRFSFGNDSTKIAPYSHKLVWLDESTHQGVLHANFAITGSPSCLYLSKPDPALISDSLCMGVLAADKSLGRRFDAATSFIIFNVPTPGSMNWIYTTDIAKINELQVQNFNTVADEYGEYDAWIELYNPNPDTLDLSGWTITNDISNPQKFRFAWDSDSLKIAPGDHLLIWADNQLYQGVRHLNFVLSNSGECLTISRPDLSFSDSACYAAVPPGESYGRTSDGAPFWMIFALPTPDSNNVDLTISVVSREIKSELIVYPNPVTDGVLKLNKHINFILNDALGRSLLQGYNRNQIDLKGLGKGVYFLQTEEYGSLRIVVK
ncbi:MAG: T9SS C-terminal target domain-containing protein [Bacteroidetes bacterium]|nr:MAG: T9SS C-terminal target domain-containing protein [Bacteroidota bacterium]REK51503.1 MAG: T9SS C-terminal target domain-containing protein [Bacteroidota bacterium]